MSHTIEELQDRIKTIANLPTLPHIASQLMRIVNEPGASAETVAALVSQDISLSAKALRLANSAFYGIPRSINTLNNAVVILGFKIIQTMVLGLTVFDMFVGEEDEEEAVFDRSGFWRHSLRCGAISRLLARKRSRGPALDPEEAFCAGLLHDIGKVVMEQHLGADFHKALRHARESGIPTFDAEREVLGYTHCDVASWLTASWALPVEIEQPIVRHHEPQLARACPDAVMICHVADLLSAAEGEDAIAETAGRLTEKAAAIGLSPQDMADVVEEIPAEVERASLFVSA